MRFTPINIVTFGLLSLAPTVLGDFHVSLVVFYSTYSSVGEVNNLAACPSNYFNCNCYQNSDRMGFIDSDGDWSPPSDFSIKSLCGEKQLNFYQDGSTWHGYINNGDGSVVATCYPGKDYAGENGSPSLSCHDPVDGVTEVYDQLVCYSYICN